MTALDTLGEAGNLVVLVCGGRGFADAAALFAALDRVHELRCIAWVVHGGTSGADRLAAEWARSRGVEALRVLADTRRYGAGAGPARNQRMLDEQRPDVVVAFPGGTETADMVRRAEAAGVPVWRPTREPRRRPPAPGPAGAPRH